MFRQLFNTFFALPNTQSLCKRFISSQPSKFGTKTYEGDGKTSVTVLNDEADSGLLINGISQAGFRLNNDVTVLGPMIIFPRTVLSWNIKSKLDINEDTLSIFTILEPKLDIIVIGVGDKVDRSLHQKLLPHMIKHRLNLEVLPTEKAAATFNFLNSEGRYVGAALIPPENIETTDHDLYLTKTRYQNLYEIKDSYIY